MTVKLFYQRFGFTRTCMNDSLKPTTRVSGFTWPPNNSYWFSEGAGQLCFLGVKPPNPPDKSNTVCAIYDLKYLQFSNACLSVLLSSVSQLSCHVRMRVVGRNRKCAENYNQGTGTVPTVSAHFRVHDNIKSTKFQGAKLRWFDAEKQTLFQPNQPNHKC